MRARKFIVPEFSAGLVILAAACILILPLKWIFFAALAAAVHEIFHLAAMKICRVHIYSIMVDASGAKIVTEPMSHGKELICAAAGPIGSLLLLLLVRWMPLLSFFGFVQGVFNLLPVYPMDGGRILKAILDVMIPRSADKISKAVGILVLLTVIWAVCRLKWTVMAGIIVIFAVRRGLERKISCKEPRLRLQ